MSSPHKDGWNEELCVKATRDRTAASVYDSERHEWVGQCPHGDVCTGCDAVGHCTREEAREGVAALTHGRHCSCSACAREDWTKIVAPCGMHGPSCPSVYAPVAAFNPDWRPRPSFRMWLRRPLRCLRLVVKGWNG